MDWTGWIIAAVTIAALYVPVMAAVLVFAMWWLFTPGLVNWAGPRRDDPLALGYRGDPKTGLGLDFETVMVPTELGPAEGWLVPAGGGPLWAIYVHGVGGLRENGFRQLSVLHEAGIPTLLIGYRNDPWGPKGRPPFYGFGLTEWRDLEAAVAWTRERGAGRIVLVAESMGAAIAGQFLMRSAEADCVAALVLDAPALDYRVIARSFIRWLPLSGVITALSFRLARAVLPVDVGTAVVSDAVRDFRGPVFVVHGTADPLVPVTISRSLAPRSGATVYVETNAAHLTSWQADRLRYQDELRRFLSRLNA
jgi:pimeloyl-ACP methyl ester carboxylesterase